MAINTVGIIGAGQMGNGIAQACAVAGIRVIMLDINDVAVERGIKSVADFAGASSSRASCGSRPCQARCEVTACRSEEKAPASMRMRRRAPSGR